MENNHLWVLERKTELSDWHPMVQEYNIGCVHYTKAAARQAMKDIREEKCLYGRNYYRVRKYVSV